MFTIHISRQKVVLWKWPSFKDQKIPIDKIEGIVKFDFIGNNKYILTLKGFTVKGSKATVTKGYVSTDQTLEEIYNEFLLSEKKNNDQINFLKDIKELIYLFEKILSEQLDHAIAIEEL